MAQVKQIGPGRKTSGTIDGITYVTRNGKTYVRSTPTMPVSAYRTPAARKRQAIFTLIQMHLKFHLRTIRQTVIVAVLVLWVCAKLIFLQIAQSVAVCVLLITIVCSFDI